MRRTLYAKKYWWRYLVDRGFPNAGPHPNITGMKEKYYGKDSYTVMCCSYLFKVDENTYYQFV